MKVSIPINGMTSTLNHKDGDSSFKLNLRPQHGYHKPVPPRKAIALLTQSYKKLFLHRGAGYENWIGVTGRNLYKNANTASPVSILSRREGEEINPHLVTAIGNILVVPTQNNTLYLIFKDGDYTNLGTFPELPVVTVNNTTSKEVRKTYKSVYGEKASDGNMLEWTKGIVSETVYEQQKEYYLHDAIVLRYAFRLYDGSITKHSAPILVMPQDYYQNMGIAELYDGGVDRFDDRDAILLKFFRMQLSYNLRSLQDWQDIIVSVDFFVSNGIGLTWTDMINDGFWRGGRRAYEAINQRIYYYKGSGQWTGSGRETGDRTSSSSTGLGTSTPTTGTRVTSTTGRTASGRPGPGRIEQRTQEGGSASIEVTKFSEASEKAIAASQLYLYFSESDYSGYKTKTFPSAETTVGQTHSNIVHQELMTNDQYSHHYIFPRKVNTFNNRLRYIGYETYLYGGYPLAMFAASLDYNGERPNEASTARKVAYVFLKTSQGERVVISPISDGGYLSAMISYPDNRAYKMIIASIIGKYEIATFMLTAHPSLNLAYYISEDLKPINLGAPSAKVVTVTENNKLEAPNTIKVSETHNPFHFPNTNTYTVGQSNILNEATIAMNVTDRNYGTYPMFVFTESGVFTMSGQTADAVHESVQAPTFMEPPISDILCSTPEGVAFVTKRGIMLINQNSTKFLSPQLRLPAGTIPIDREKFAIPNIKMQLVDFMEYLQKLKYMVYNPYEHELIIYAEDYEYSYIYSFDYDSFYISTEQVWLVVENAYPDMYVIKGNMLIDYSLPESSRAEIALITRPLNFGTPDIKQLHRFTLRSLLYEAIGLDVALYRSMDSVNFEPIKGIRYENGFNYKDADLGLLSQQTHRQFIVAMSAEVDEQTQIQLMDFEIEPNYDDEKLR